MIIRAIQNRSNHQAIITQEHGAVLMTTLLLLVLLSALAIGSIKSAAINTMTAGAYKNGKMAYYSAETGLDLAVSEIIDIFEDLTVYTDSGGFLTQANFNGYDIQYKIENPLDRYLYQSVVGNSILYHFAYTYDIEATSDAILGKSGETLHETVRILETPLTQFFIFYGGTGNEADLEWLPGPDFTSWGRVHSNGDIYIGSGGTLELRNYDLLGNLSPHSMTAGGSIYRYRKNDGSSTGGTVRVKIDSIAAVPFPAEDITGDITTANEVAEEARFNDYVLVNEEVRTSISQQTLVRDSFYEQRADDPQTPTVDTIKIVDQGGGLEVFVSRPATVDVTNLILAVPPEVAFGVPATNVGAGPIIQETLAGMNDQREGRPVDFTDIDMNLLETWYLDYLDYLEDGVIQPEAGRDPTDFLAGEGILLYASRSPNGAFTNGGASLQAIRLVPSANPQLFDETTIVSDNPVYIQGDFNTNNTRGVAIVTDAINILSNNWNTTGGCNNGGPNATATTINAAFIAGNVPTPGGGGTYSGGLENYPRLHENWNGIPLNINGSFSNLWSSAQATATWAYGCPIYQAPQRNWGWDINFQDPDYWPPFLPSMFSVERAGFSE